MIPPGEEGKIAIKVDTNGYGGDRLRKTIKVYTSDPQQSQIQLSVSGTVKKFATITPKNVQLIGSAGTAVKGTVAIVPEKNYPFKIVNTRAQSGRNIRYALKEEKNSEKLTYVLTIENLKQEKGRYYDKIELETDSQLKPKISIPVYGRITEPKRTN